MASLPGRLPFNSVITANFIFAFFSLSVITATEFDFGTLTFSGLNLLGEAHWTNGSVRLNRDLGVPNSGAGKAVYSKPIKFRLPGTQSPASFSTFFTFSITHLNPSSIGGGLAFVISPDAESIGGAGGFMGIVDSTGGPNGVVAVEFDTLMDVEFKDINGNHVGLDVNSVISTQVGDLETAGVDLKSGDSVNSWIDYSGSNRIINVYVSYSNSKPKEPIISAPFDLTEYIENDSIFVGFSGSTQGSTETHTIEWWSFASSFDENPSSTSSETPPEIPNPPPPAAEPAAENITTTTPKSNGKCHNKNCQNGAVAAAVAGVVTAGAFCLAFCGVAFIWAYKKRFKNPENPASNVIKMPKEFTYKDLKTATKGFSPDRIIGNGAFGTVYRGILPVTGDIVAVKRCSHVGQGKTEFLSELSIIGALRHRNLVRLQGWCYEKGEILLVYDLMSNGSLDKALFNSIIVLPWPHRLKILRGLALALSYLHQECENQVIHRDIKTSNIMLDEGFNARLGDFGLARQIEHDKSPDATVAAGTMGYLAPEYLLTGRASDKTDVFSYGAVALEVATGRRPIEGGAGVGGRSSNLVEWVWGLHMEGRLMAGVDPRLGPGPGYDEAQVRTVMLVGLACSHPDPVARPSMRSVMQMLVGDCEVPIVPRTKPSLSFTTSQLLLNLQDSVSDLNGMIAISTTSSETSFRRGGGGGGLDLV